MSENEDLVLQALAEFLNGVDSAVQSARVFLKKVKVEGWDLGRITWGQAQGNKGPYEKAEKQENTDYRLLVKDLSEHGGKPRREGIFYWLFEDGKIVGRKRQEKREARRTKPSKPLAETPRGQPTGAPSQRREVDDVQRVFPQDLASMLYFEVTEEYVLVKPREYLGSDIFRRIAAVVRDELNGEYISAGKDSHFRVPVRK